MTPDIDGLTVAQLLQDAARDAPDAPFVHFGAETRSYRDIDEAARRYSGGLADAGVAAGALVGIMMRNCIEFIELYAALAYRGAAVVLINPDYRGYMLEYVLNDAACDVVIADLESVDELRRSAERLESLSTVLTVEDGAREPAEPLEGGPLCVRRLVPGDPDEAPGADVDPRDLHCIVYSSGTTGPSKGIMISNAHALVKALEVIRICGFTSDDILYSPLPLFYSMGLMRGVLSVALMRSAIVLRDKFSVSQYWDDVRRHGATVAHSVFSLPVLLASAPPQPGDRDNSLRCMFNARFDPAFEERFGVRLIEGYGLTEAGNAIYSRWDEPAVEGSCGRVSDEWEVRLALPDESEAAVGETGEIQLRPLLPNRIMIGYLNQPEATVAATRDLWFRTGDLASRDDAGHYFYQGRIKEMIRRRGQNISAWEVERIVSTFPGIAEVAALAHPAAVGDDDVRIVVVPALGTSIDLARLARHCEQNMPPFMVPRYFEMRGELPKTPSGRVEKYKLSELPISEDALDRGDRTARTAGVSP